MSEQDELDEFLGKVGKKEKPKIPKYFDEEVQDLAGNKSTIRTSTAELIGSIRKMRKWYPDSAKDRMIKERILRVHTSRLKGAGLWEQASRILDGTEKKDDFEEFIDKIANNIPDQAKPYVNKAFIRKWIEITKNSDGRVVKIDMHHMTMHKDIDWMLKFEPNDAVASALRKKIATEVHGTFHKMADKYGLNNG